MFESDKNALLIDVENGYPLVTTKAASKQIHGRFGREILAARAPGATDLRHALHDMGILIDTVIELTTLKSTCIVLSSRWHKCCQLLRERRGV
jgi:hypothetical protein